MQTRTLNQPIADTRLLVKGALELIDDIKSYNETDGEIVAKTGFRFGLLASSYGESLTISIHPRDDATTVVSVHGEKNVTVNVGANPDKYVLEFFQTLDTLADYPMADVIDLLDEHTSGHSKEVHSPAAQTDGTFVLAIILGGILVLTFLSLALV